MTVKVNYHIEKPITDIEIPYHEGIIGIDPGTANLGLCYLWRNVASLYEIELVERKTSIQVISSVWEVMKIFSEVDYKEIVIEGASYNERFGQVSLETVRSAFVAWSIMKNKSAVVVPPKTIRKVSFGSGKIKNPYDDIPDNAAAAFGCALYPIMKEKQDE